VLRTADLDYDLPAELIATRPVEPRDSARLMVIDRRAVASAAPGRMHIDHAIVRELPEILRPGDLLVFNTTRVLPARFRGRRVGTGGKIEGLYLHEARATEIGSAISVSSGQAHRDPKADLGGTSWVALIKGRHTRAGAILELHDRRGHPSGIRLHVLGRPDDEPEAWLVRIEPKGLTTHEVLERTGLTPLPPYILKARRDRGIGDEAEDASRYQTVYASEAAGNAGSVAAPTAGLHFTPELLARLQERGIGRAEVVLHVGAATFRPVETEFVEQHPMHAEWCSMSPAVKGQIEETRQRGGRVIPVGTTAVRTLEAYALAAEQGDHPEWLSTRLLITPGYRFRWCDGMLTNFHLPRSTLMALVAALLARGWQHQPPDASRRTSLSSGGAAMDDAQDGPHHCAANRVAPSEAEAKAAASDATRDDAIHGDAPRDATPVEVLKHLYTEAAQRGYRFYSFGDAMLIV
jgi:S-adenosylmethionine:tRNA ribosyltransferase-isomerase